MRSEAKTVAQYLDELTPERRELVEPVLKLISDNLPVGYAETMSWRMIGWRVPLSVYPDAYNNMWEYNNG